MGTSLTHCKNQATEVWDVGVGSGGSKYTGPLQCAATIIKHEGMRGLFKGWTANYVRLGPQTTVIFVVMEQLRKATGLESL